VNVSDEGNVRPAFLGPHEGRELELMLAGKKHLSYFFFEEGFEPNGFFPESQFDAAVAEGLLVKDERSERLVYREDGTQIDVRNVLYATADEAWRIPAMRMVQDIYAAMGPGWRPDLERMIGSLLGYDQQHVELFIERLAKQHG
jgi:hypothetical protein